MYSQNNEEEIIIKHIANIPNGKFVEIGSYDPFKFSNTRKLVEMGWSGVYVEPAAPCFKKFVKEYGENNPKIKLVNVAIGNQSGMMKFYECADAISTSDEKWKTLWETNNGVKYTETLVPVITGKELFDNYCDVINFLNIDTEATNIEVLNSIPPEYIKKCDLVCIEHQSEIEYLRSYFTKLGFIEVLHNPENLIFKRV